MTRRHPLRAALARRIEQRRSLASMACCAVVAFVATPSAMGAPLRVTLFVAAIAAGFALLLCAVARVDRGVR